MNSSGFVDLYFLALTEAIALGAALPEKYLLVDNKTDLGSNLTVAQEEAKAAEAQKVIDGAINKVGQLDATYSLLDTLNNIDGARPEVVDGATAYKLLDGVLTIEGPQTVALAQAEIARGQALVDGSANAAGTIYKPVYELADTLANLEKAPVLVEGAESYALTNEPGNLGPLTPAQIKLVEGASDASEYTWEIGPNDARLTPGTDIVEGTFFDGSAEISGGVRFQTLNSTDVLTGQGEEASLFVQMVNAAATVVTPKSMANIKNVDVDLSFSTAASTINAINSDAISNVKISNGGFAFTLNNLNTAVSDLSIENATAGAIGVRSTAAALAGAADEITVKVSDSVFGGLTLSPLTGSNGYETINMASEGSIANNLGGLVSSGTTTLNVAGAANLTTNQLDNSITTVNAGDMTGNLNVTLGNGATTSTGGSGNDTFVFNAGQFTTADAVDGGAGVNVIQAAYADVVSRTAADTDIKSVQVLRVDTDATTSSGNDTIRADFLGDSLRTVEFTNSTGGVANNTVRFESGANAVVYNDFNGGIGGVFNNLTAQANGTSTSDSLRLTLDGDDPSVAGTTTTNITIGNVDTSTASLAIEKLDIVSVNATNFHLIGTITLPNTVGVVDAVSISGTSALTIGVITADKLDASGLTGGAGLTMTVPGGATRAIEITGSAAADTLFGSTVGDVISTGNGANAVTAGTGADQVALGANVDTITQGTLDSVATASGVSATTPIIVGDVFDFSGGVDQIASFTAGANGDILAVQGASALPVSALGVNDDGLVAGTNYYLSGTWNSAAGSFTVTNNGVGADTLIVQGYAAAGTDIYTNASAVVLVGVDSDLLVAGNFA